MAGGGLAAIGELISGFGSYYASKAQAKALRAGAEMAKQEAGVASNIALEEGDRVQARAATQAAASGGGLTGSAMGVLEDLGRQSMYRARQAVYEGVTEANRLTFQARVAKKQGQIALVTSMFKAAATFMGDASATAQQVQAAQGGGSAAAGGGGSSAAAGAG